MKKTIVSATLMAALGLSQQVHAVELDGFLSAGFATHDLEDATYLDTISDDIRFDNDSKFGLQISADVAENMQAVAQILGAGSDENFDMDVEWAYIDWSLSDSISLRGGKVKEPVFLISDYLEVGYAYPWIRPPQEVYRNNPINTINGLQGLFQADLGNMSLVFQPYLGSNNEAVPNTNGDLVFDASNFYGAAIQLQARAFTVQMSYLTTDVTTTEVSGVPGAPFTGFQASGSAELISAGVSWDVNNFIGYAEYVTRDISGDAVVGVSPAMGAIFPDQDAWYLTVGYRMGKFLPHLTVASSEATPESAVPEFANQGVSQDSITLGLRYEVNDSSSLKFEIQTIEPDLDANSGGLFGQTAVVLDNTGFPIGGGTPAVGSLTSGDSVTMISAQLDIIF